MFSKRHYEAMAETISRNHETTHELILEMINMFERDNPKFDRVKFLDACGLAIDKPEIMEAQL